MSTKPGSKQANKSKVTNQSSRSKLKLALDEKMAELGSSAESWEHVQLYGCCPPIDRLDANLKNLQSCRKLSLSTNAIDKLIGLPALPHLQILSVGRNAIKRLDGIEAVGNTIEELWISYNQLESFSSIESCTSLKVLYASNNKIRDWTEIDRLSKLKNLVDLLFIGNPLYNQYRDAGTLATYQQEVQKRLPQLKKLDGELLRADTS